LISVAIHLQFNLHSNDTLRNDYQTDIRKLDDWNKITAEFVISQGGGGWLGRYKGSLIAALKDVYPYHPWKLERHPQNVGGSKSQHILYPVRLDQALTYKDFKW
jgi:hypothetical protein